MTQAELITKITGQAAVKTPLVVAFDGRSGTGKSTLARQLATKVGACVIESDDFYSGGSLDVWASRTPEQNASVCIDWQRLKTEALEPLLAGKTARWHAFDWDAMTGVVPEVTVCRPAPIIFLEGVYSCRPELDDLVDMRVLVRVPEDVRQAQLHKREGDALHDPMQKYWDEAEQYYFSHTSPESRFDHIYMV